jgi:hypothetical protein
MVMKNYATAEELLEVMFYMWSMWRLHKENQLEFLVGPLVDAGSDTSTVALQDVGGEEKGIHCQVV